MKKRVFIVHGWGGSPEEAWFPWLKKELEMQKYEVRVLKMPHPDKPTIKDWVGALSKAAGKPDRHTFFVGHSIGCQTIMRFMEKQTEQAGGAVFVAGFIKMDEQHGPWQPGEWDILRPWMEAPLDTEQVKHRLPIITAIFSDNDKRVPPENAQLFRDRLGAKSMVVKNKGHLGGEDNVREFGPVLSALLDMAR